MASYHRLATTIKAWRDYSRKQLEAAISQAEAPAQDISEEFYERRRCEFLNNFNNRDLIQIGKEAKYTMAFNDIEPIIIPNIPYGGREPYQEVKAHLISPYSYDVNASSRSVCDNWISQRGDKPLIISHGPDHVSHRPYSTFAELTGWPKAGTSDRKDESIPWSEVDKKKVYSMITNEVMQYKSFIEASYLYWKRYQLYTLHRPWDDFAEVVATYALMALVINVTNSIIYRRPWNTEGSIYLHKLSCDRLEEIEHCKYDQEAFAWAAQHREEGYFVSSFPLDLYLEVYEKIEKEIGEL